jgi:hypothetical protein
VRAREDERLLKKLEEAKTRRPASRLATVLRRLARSPAASASGLIRFHEVLLFLRAYPPDRGVLRRVESLLRSFRDRVERFAAAGGDLAAFDTPEVSGIAGTTITTDYSYDVVRWLKQRHGRRVRIDWESFEGTDRLRALLPSFLPLLEEEALEDANVPYRTYLRAAGGRAGDELELLLSRIAKLPLPEREKAERYEALGLSMTWDLKNRAGTRTRMRWPTSRIFFHDGPLIARRNVSIEAELAGPKLPSRKLSRQEGQGFLDMTREATALRYREYYGFTYGDPTSVRRFLAGRGVEIFLFGLEPGRRLPLRAGFAGFIIKNGVPIGYVEALALFDRIEIGFNIYYTFREGESAWIFAKVLKVLRQALAVTSFSIDPYQIGHENPEAIDAGAFWFYRKLGFRSTSPSLRGLTETEERRLAADPAHRTPPRLLRRLAQSNLLYEVPPTRFGEWDLFHVRHLGLAATRRMAREGVGADEFRKLSSARVSRALGVRPRGGPPEAWWAFENLALVLDLVPDLQDWTEEEKRGVVEIARAKAGRGEAKYLRLLQGHARLRAAFLRLGSAVRN